MSKTRIKHWALIGLFFYFNFEALACVQKASFELAITLSGRILEQSTNGLDLAHALRKCTNRPAADSTMALIRVQLKSSQQDCRYLDESLPQGSDDPRLDLQEIRLNAMQMDANARFAIMALDDLAHALDIQDLHLKGRALREIEGGIRFLRFMAAETNYALRDLARLSP